LYKSGVRTASRSYKMRANLAIEYLRLGRCREALDTAHEALAIDPQGRGARDVAACALDSLGRRDEAIGFLQESLPGDPQDAGARRRLLYMLIKNGRNEEAGSAAAGGMSLDPTSAEWTAWAAKSTQTRGDYAGAAGLWKTAEEQSPQAVDPPLNLAFCLLRSGNQSGACRAYAEAVRLDPQLAQAAEQACRRDPANSSFRKRIDEIAAKCR
jgi:tetratricopeptide (TPR) repeat protein